MKTRAAVVIGALLLAFFIGHQVLNGSAPLPAPPPFVGGFPPATPPAQMRLFRLPTGVAHRSAAFAYRGGSILDAREFTMTAVLVHHPRGDVLIDTGFGREVDRHFGDMPFFFRAVTRYTKGIPAADQLAALGWDRTKLRGILLTHAHWDHASGIPDFPGVPVLVTKEERRFIDEGGFLTAAARKANARFETYAFEGGRYLGFPAQHDLFDDGSVVVVQAPGHTPGSVVIFVTNAGGLRYAFIGDLAWQREGILEREERPFPARTLGDFDAVAVREGLSHVSSLATRFPELVLVPAHDERGFQSIPRLIPYDRVARRTHRAP